MKTAKCKRWLLSTCTLLLLLVWGHAHPGAIALAEGTIQLGVSVGIDGVYREEGLVPVVVTATNGGTDVEGDLMVATGNRGNNQYSVAYYQPVSIAKGATKQVTIMVPGSELDSSTYVALMEKDKIVAKAPVSGRRYSYDTLMIGVLAQSADTANFLGMLPKDTFPNDVKTVPMKPEHVPTSGAQMQMLSMLVLNNFALDSLNEQQIQAIRDWTKSGGKLVLAGGAQYRKTAGALADLSPVEVNQVTSVKTLASMKAEKTNPIGLTAPFTVSSGTLKAGKVLYSEGAIPLFAVHSVGEGKVLYAAYDLAEEPVASWAGNGRFWSDLLLKAFGSSLNDYKSSSFDRIWPLHDAADMNPALKIPEVSWFALFFGVYALIAGPILFFILRAWRKQSYMWVVVPSLSLLTGIGIFSFGAMQRGEGVLIHQTGFVQLQNDGQAKVNSVTSFFVPSSGDYRLTVKGQGQTQPVLERNRANEIPKIWAFAQSDQTEVQFRDVEFWSTRKVATEQTISDVGSFESNLSYSEGTLKGTVTNKTKFALRDLTIFSGSQLQEIPELAPGASAEVNLPFQPSAQARFGHRQSYAMQALPAHMRSFQNERTREQVMIEMLEMTGRRGNQSEIVRIVGWTNQPVVDAAVQPENAKTDSIALVTSELKVQPSKDGHVYYPTGTFDVTLAGSSVPVVDEGDGYRLEAGDITFDINLSQEGKKLAITNVYLYTWSDDNTTFAKEVYNWKTKAYDLYEKAFNNNVMTGDKAADYVSADGMLRIKFAHQLPDQRHIGIPNVSVEGKVSPL
ncbi:DUF7408 domain-containing protein [Brevibacillus agri]|uniref:DUF7408 domain-containing protein n=1 Tax=Brevibacillus agri TaxID=51101 RepID=UPI000470B83D|nr:hypothetical protein [Brevibacillus agri]MBG9565302.1 hypothetical protein [Brevibacillus agri]